MHPLTVLICILLLLNVVQAAPDGCSPKDFSFKQQKKLSQEHVDALGKYAGESCSANDCTVKALGVLKYLNSGDKADLRVFEGSWLHTNQIAELAPNNRFKYTIFLDNQEIQEFYIQE